MFGSSVNVDEPDLKRHPLYANVSPLRVVLNPGDTLYLPAYWHHEVQSLPEKAAAGSGEGEQGEGKWTGPLNVAVNFWFANLSAPIDEKVLLKI